MKTKKELLMEIEKMSMATYLTTKPLDSEFAKGFYNGIAAIQNELKELLK